MSDDSLSDFTFVVGEKEFKVHKVILSLASPVMHSMFTTNMSESRDGLCKVTNIEPHIFELLLRFVYCGTWPTDNEDLLMSICEAAHYYRVEELKVVCEDELLKSLSLENAYKIYAWTWTYELEILKNEAWKVIK